MTPFSGHKEARFFFLNVTCNRIEGVVTTCSPFQRVPEHDSSIVEESIQNV